MRKLITLFFLFSAILYSCKTTKVVQKDTKKAVVVAPKPEKPVEEKPKETIKQSKEISIALMLPLYLQQNFDIDTSDTDADIDSRSLPALSFYEGALLAADSLEKAGMKVKLNVIDIAKDSSARHALLLNYQTLKNCDVVFALFPSSQSVAAADAAKQYGMKLVLTQSSTPAPVNDNQQVVLAAPSSVTQCRLMADYITNEYHFSKFIVLSRNQKRENELAEVFKKETDSLLLKKFKGEAGAIIFSYPDSGKKMFVNYLSAEQRNIIYLPSSDESYVSSILNMLNDLEKNVTVVGLPTWENFESIQFSKLSNLEIYLFTTTYINTEDTRLASFRKKYITHYKTDPFFNAYQGAELTDYFTKLFNKYDKKFLEQTANETTGSSFKFLNSNPKNGFENTTISVLKYADYKLMKIN